jgi:membrane protein DedA with SNARE-associated domain
MTVAALARQSPYQITQIILTGVSSALIAELALYWCGRHYGQRFLGLLCRLSFSPDFCVRRIEEVFARVGSWSLLFSKFIPGLTLITIAVAGVTKMPVLAFLLLDGIGAVLFISAVVTLGVLFHDAITSVLLTLANLGKIGGLIVLAALVLYALTRWWRRRLTASSESSPKRPYAKRFLGVFEYLCVRIRASPERRLRHPDRTVSSNIDLESNSRASAWAARALASARAVSSPVTARSPVPFPVPLSSVRGG